jgi:hypothetical protein
VGVQAVVWTGAVYAIGLHFNRIWLMHMTGSAEHDCEQRDFLLMNKFAVGSWDAVALAIDLGVGVTWYRGQVDVPADPPFAEAFTHQGDGVVPVLRVPSASVREVAGGAAVPS